MRVDFGAVGERHGLRGLAEREAALDEEEAADREVDVARHFEHLAKLTGEIEVHGRVRPDEDGDRFGAIIDHTEVGGVSVGDAVNLVERDG